MRVAKGKRDCLPPPPLGLWGTILQGLFDMPVVRLPNEGGMHARKTRTTSVTTRQLSSIGYTVGTSWVEGSGDTHKPPPPLSEMSILIMPRKAVSPLICLTC